MNIQPENTEEGSALMEANIEVPDVRGDVYKRQLLDSALIWADAVVQFKLL